MKKPLFFTSLFLPLLLGGCSPIGEKSASFSIIYGFCAALSLLLLIGYCCAIRKKNLWFLLLFASVLIVNIGYFSLSVSKNLDEALLANRISYLGSVFLPMAMLVIILNAAKLPCPKWLIGLLLFAGVFVFFVAASPGYSTIYYQEVTFSVTNGVSALTKVYGPWHKLYLMYLSAYFLVTVGVVIYTAAKKRIASAVHTAILAAAVCVNVGVWLIEQLVKIDFEILSLSYIISELFLLGLHVLLQNADTPPLNSDPTPAGEPAPVEPPPSATQISDDAYTLFMEGLSSLTKTERTVFRLYVSGKSTKDVLQELNITENTLKFHNKNLYSKLGVTSRKQLLEIYRSIPHTELS